MREKSVLIIKHYEKFPGGTDRNVKSIIEGLRGINFYILFKLGRKIYVEKYKKGKYINTLVFNIRGKETAFLKKTLHEVIQVFNIGLIHFQHLAGFDNDILTVPSRKDVKSILSIHDISYLSDPVFLSERINLANLIIFPSNFLYQQYKRYIKSAYKIIEHGIDLPKIKKKNIQVDRKLNIGFLGLLSPHKGIDIFFDLIQELDGPNDFNWFAFGQPIGDLGRLLKKHGIRKGVDIDIYPYSNSDPQSLIKKHNIDLFVFPSTIPESFGYTLSEAWQSGIPSVVYDIGALSERVRASKAGFVYGSFEELVSLLRDVNRNRSLLNEKIQKVNKLKLRKTESMIADYKNLYEKLYTMKTGSNTESFTLKYRIEKNPKIFTLGDRIREFLRIHNR